MASDELTEQYRALFAGLVRNPASEIRREAVLKRAELADDIARHPATELGDLAGELAGVDRFIRWGDELRGVTNPTDRQERRRMYARAYLRAREAQIRLLGQYNGVLR